MIEGQIVEGRGAFLDLVVQGRQLDAQVRKALRDLAAEYETKLKGRLQGARSGRRYARSTGKKAYNRVEVRSNVFGRDVKYKTVQKAPISTLAYTASAPGQAPAVRTGNLLRSVRTRPAKGSKGYGLKVFEDAGVAFYRRFLEMGAGPAKKGKRRGAGGLRLPRPVITPLQAELDIVLMARLEQAVDDFVAARR